MPRVLIVDNEEKLRQAIVKYARFQGYDTAEAADGVEAVELCQAQAFDLILLDVMMPRMDGVTACRHIRKLCDTPIIMLTARGEEFDRILGFESGADDYVVKPFSPKELMLRMNVLLKRSAPPPQEKRALTFDGIELSLEGRWLEVDGKRVGLTSKEFDLLACLAAHPGAALSRSTLYQEVWGCGDDGENRTLDTHIKQLRKALGPYSACIATLRGVGYRFEAP